MIIENNLIKYRFIPQRGENFTAAMQHFLLETADSVVEDFVITTIIGKWIPVKINDIRRLLVVFPFLDCQVQEQTALII